MIIASKTVLEQKLHMDFLLDHNIPSCIENKVFRNNFNELIDVNNTSNFCVRWKIALQRFEFRFKMKNTSQCNNSNITSKCCVWFLKYHNRIIREN